MENVSNSSNFVKDKYTAEELWLPKEYWILKIPVWEHLLASDYWAPQNRKRYVCWDFPLPKKTHEWKEVLIENVLGELWDTFFWEKKEIIKDPVYWFKIDSKHSIIYLCFVLKLLIKTDILRFGSWNSTGRVILFIIL